MPKVEIGTSPATVAAAPAGRRGGRGAKRSAEDLQALSATLASFVKAHSGLRIEQINKELGTTTKDLALPHPQARRPRDDQHEGQEAVNGVHPGQEGEVGARPRS